MGQFKFGDKVYFKGQEVEIRKVITNHATQQTLYELDTWDIVEGGLLSRVKPEKEEPIMVEDIVVEPEKPQEYKPQNSAKPYSKKKKNRK